VTENAANPTVAPSSKTVSFEDNVGVRIVRLAEVFSRLAKIGVEQPWGLRGTELRILNILDRVDSVPISEIARRTHVDKAWISRTVRDLEKKGLVTRRADQTDSRKTHAVLTGKGRALLDRLRPLVVWHEARVLKGIDEPAFKRDLDRLLANAEAILEVAETLPKAD
jgi:DNA-binding MarR family transcriptional regulator